MVCLGLRRRWQLVIASILVVLAAVSHVAGDEAVPNSVGQQPFAGVPLYPAANQSGATSPTQPTTPEPGASRITPKLANEQVGDPGDVQKIAFDGLRLFTAHQL